MKKGNSKNYTARQAGAKKTRPVKRSKRLASSVKVAPLALTRQMRTDRPNLSMSQGSDGRIRVRHREYVADVAGSVAYSVADYDVNPGLRDLFPWLSGVAKLFESYQFRDLKFEYETQKSASTNGTAMMAVDFDAADQDPPDKQILMAYHNSVRTAVWEEAKCLCDRQDLAKFGTQRFVRSVDLAANLDIKTYDIGKFFVATQGCADTTAVGELYVSYDVEFMTPQWDNAAGNLNVMCAKVVGNGSITKDNCLGDTPIITGSLKVTAVNETITFDTPGRYLASEYLVGTGLSFNATGSTATASNLATAGGATTAAITVYLVVVSAPGQTLKVEASASTTVTASSVWICPLESSVSLNDVLAPLSRLVLQEEDDPRLRVDQHAPTSSVDIPKAAVRQRSMTFFPLGSR